jgi:hypothetical protein
MSTSLLKFQTPNQTPGEVPLDPGILAGAVDASPEPMALTENGKLIYANRSLAQLSVPFGEGVSNNPPGNTPGPIAVSCDPGWRTTDAKLW